MCRDFLSAPMRDRPEPVEYGPVWADAPPMGGRDSSPPTSLASLGVRPLPGLLTVVFPRGEYPIKVSTSLTARGSSPLAWGTRRLDTPRVFLYKGRPWKNPRTAFSSACRRAGITGLRLHDLRHCAATNLRRAGVDTTTAMKIIGHKSEQMHRRYNTIQSEDLHEAAAKLQRYRANTVITLASLTVSRQNISHCNS
jgi:hypothetical protein